MGSELKRKSDRGEKRKEKKKKSKKSKHEKSEPVNSIVDSVGNGGSSDEILGHGRDNAAEEALEVASRVGAGQEGEELSSQIDENDSVRVSEEGSRSRNKDDDLYKKDKKKKKKSERPISKPKKRKLSDISDKGKSSSDSESIDSDNVFTAYVEGIPFQCEEDTLWELFSSCGNLLDVRLPKWNDSGRLKGYGHFDFEKKRGLKKAISQLNGHEMNGRYITVVKANPKRTSEANGTRSAASLSDLPDTCMTLFVKNLPYDIDEDIVLEAFSVFGNVVSVRLARWNHTGRLKGFGYVQFKRHESLRSCLSSENPIMVCDRRVVVDADIAGEGRPKNSYRDALGRFWKKNEGRMLHSHSSKPGNGKDQRKRRK